MNTESKERFITLWKKYFNNAELPIIFYYCNSPGTIDVAEPPSGHSCIIGAMGKVRGGKSLCFQQGSLGCNGARRYLGYAEDMMPDFEYFLSCGIPGKMEGERYKKSPDIVREMMKNSVRFRAPEKYITFKRWDMMDDTDDPRVVIFFAGADVLSGLFTLTGFDDSDLESVIAPFSAGCGSIVQIPYLQNENEKPKCVLGMFDVSARPYMQAHVLSFAVPIKKFNVMVDNMEESFLRTGSWEKIKRRIP